MSGNDLPQLDTRHAHPARVYNYWLGGKDNFAADREAAEQAIAANPGIKTDVRANRFFDGLDLVEPGVVQPSSGGPSRER
jgi:hypothetical protein